MKINNSLASSDLTNSSQFETHANMQNILVLNLFCSFLAYVGLRVKCTIFVTLSEHKDFNEFTHYTFINVTGFMETDPNRTLEVTR